MSRRKYNIQGIIACLNVFLWIMLSGSVVMLQQGAVFIPLVLFFFLLQLVLQHKFCVRTYNFAVLALFAGIYFISYLIYMDECWGAQQYWVNILLLFCSFAFAELFSESDFKNRYVNVMVAISLYSLAMHYGGMLFGWNNLAVRKGNLMPVGLHNYWAFSVGRNSGVFWEPGGYQIFLNLALIFSVLEHARNASRQEWWKRIIFIITILTTKSTTGFALMAVICVAILRMALRNVQRQRNRALAWIAYCLAVAGIFVWLFTSEAIQSKLFMENISTTIRLKDFTESIQLLGQAPIYGIGVNTLTKDQLLKSVGIVNNSVGVFASALNFGPIYIMIYIFLVFKNFKINAGGGTSFLQRG